MPAPQVGVTLRSTTDTRRPFYGCQLFATNANKPHANGTIMKMTLKQTGEEVEYRDENNAVVQLLLINRGHEAELEIAVDTALISLGEAAGSANNWLNANPIPGTPVGGTTARKMVMYERIAIPELDLFGYVAAMTVNFTQSGFATLTVTLKRWAAMGENVVAVLPS